MSSLDRGTVADLAVSSGLFSVDDIDIVQEMMDAYFARRSGEGHACVVHEDDDGVSAVAYYEPAVATDGTWYLTMIAVAKDRQGQGRGTAMLTHVETDLRSRAQRLVLAETSGLPGFSRTRGFYAKCGYHEEARVRDYYGTGDDMVLFRKHLTAGDSGVAS